MLDRKNLVQLEGGLTADPEVTDKLVKFSIAIDRAGSEGGANATGYFDVVFWLNPDYAQPQVLKFVRDITSGPDAKLKKGSRVSIMGRLVHQRWTSADGKRSKIEVTAESISWASDGSSAKSEGSTGTYATATASSSVPDEF